MKRKQGKKGELALEIRQLSFEFGDNLIFDQLNLSLYMKKIYGIIGINGAGKSTLLQLAEGISPAEYQGSIVRITPFVSSLSQHFNGDITQNVEEYLHAPFTRYNDKLIKLHKQLENAKSLDHSKFLTEYQTTIDEYETEWGDDFLYKVDRILSIRGISHLRKRILSTLSGGELRMVEIASLVLRSTGLLLLDEPDNYLDSRQMVTISRMINNYAGCVLMVSHNRYLMDACCTNILHIEQKQINEYAGNYSFFKKVMLERQVAQAIHAVQDNMHISQQQIIVSNIAAIAEKSSDPAWGRKLRARKKILERAEKRAEKLPFIQRRDLSLTFQTAQNFNKGPLLTFSNYTAHIKEHILFTCGNNHLMPCDRVALWGPNGCGKSTLLNEIFGKKAQGILHSSSLCIGYLRQQKNAFRSTRDMRSIIDYIRKQPGINLESAIDSLMNLGFSENRLFRQAMSTLSGGEYSIIQLALIAQRPYNLLLLDEPMNHLDVFAQDSLWRALVDFKGAVILVTHDPYWLQRIGKRVWFIRNGYLVESTADEFFLQHDEDGDMASLYRIYSDAQRQIEEYEKNITAALCADDYKSAREICAQMFLPRQIASSLDN